MYKSKGTTQNHRYHVFPCASFVSFCWSSHFFFIRVATPSTHVTVTPHEQWLCIPNDQAGCRVVMCAMCCWYPNFSHSLFFCSISFSVFSFFFLCNTCFSLGAYSFCQALSFLRRSLLISMWQFGCLFIIVSLSLFVFLLCISEHHILSKTPSDFSSRIVSFLLIYKYSLYLLHQKYKDFNAADIFSECSCTSLAYFYCFVSIQSLMSNTL